jgi:hypothetical protein
VTDLPPDPTSDPPVHDDDLEATLREELGNLHGPWEGRVAVADGPAGYAHRPGAVIVHGPDALASALAMLGLSEGEATVPLGMDTLGFQVIEHQSLRGREAWLVAELALRGFRSSLDHVMFADSSAWSCCCGGCGDGQPFASPVYASPVYASPVYASPVYASGLYASTTHASPVYASPVYASPVYASPVYASGYRRTGRRTNSARPAEAGDAWHVPPAWAEAAHGPNVLVLDTGLAWEAPNPEKQPPMIPEIPAYLERLGRPARWDVDWPDGPPAGPSDGQLDPAAGHGTFVAGLIERLAPGCQLGVGKVLSGFGDGREWLIGLRLLWISAFGFPIRGPDGQERYRVSLDHAVVNLSFSGYASWDMLFLGAVIRYLQDLHGAVFVASAGNDGSCRPTFPAAFPGVIGVGGLGPSGPAGFSNHGPWVRACAPAMDLVSCTFRDWNGPIEPLPGSPDPDHFKGWARWSGTSFAAPIVAGAIAREMVLSGSTARDAAARVVDAPWLLRLPGLGTVVNLL